MGRLFTSTKDVEGDFSCLHIATITVIWPPYMQQKACVLLDIRACKAEEIFQEFIKYLSLSQTLDWMSSYEDQ